MRLSLSSPPEADGAGEAPQGRTPPPPPLNPDAAAMPPSHEIGESARNTAPGPQHPTIPTAASSRPATNNPPAASSAPALPSSSAAAPSAPAPTTLATGQTGTPRLDDTLSEATMVMIKEAAKNFVKEFGPKLCGKKKELKLPRFDASDLFAYFAKVAFNQAYGTHDVTDFPDELLSSGEDTTLPSVPSFNFMAQSPVAQHAESMSFSELERGYEEWRLSLNGALSSTLRSTHPEEASTQNSEANQSATPEGGPSGSIPAKDPQEHRRQTPTASPKTANTSAEKSSESEQTHEATESDQSRVDTTEDSGLPNQQEPQTERSVDEPSKKTSPQPSPQQLQPEESDANESTTDICIANLPLYLQNLALNQAENNADEPSEEPSRPSPRQQDPLPPNFGAGFGLPADYDNGDPTIMDVPQYAFEDGVANTPKSTQTNAKMWRPKAMEVVQEATEPTASSINTTTDSLLTASNDSQEPSGSIPSSSAQQNRSTKRKTTEKGDASDAKSPKKDRPIDFAMLEAALEPFRSTVPRNVDIAEGSYIIPPWFYADLDEFEFSNRAPAPPNSLASLSGSGKSSESEDNGDAEVDEHMEVDEAGSEGGEKSDKRKAASEDGHDDSDAYFTAAEGDDEDSDADSNIGNAQSSNVDDQSADQIPKKSEDEAKKGVSKPSKPNEASPKHGSSSNSSGSDSESDDDADANANANIAEPIEVIEIDSDAASQKSEGSKAETIVIDASEGVSDDGSNKTIEIGDDSDVEMIQLSGDERMNESEDRHDVEEVVDTGTDANDQHQPSSSQAHIDSQPRNVQPSPKARTKSRLRQIFEDQQAKKKAQEEAMARTKRRIRKQLMEKRAKQKARRARQYNRSPMKSRLRQLYEDGLKKALLAQQQNAATNSTDNTAAAPTTPEALTSAPEAESVIPTPPANNEEMEMDRSHEAAGSNEQPSVENPVIQAPPSPANSTRNPIEAAPVPEDVPEERITGWVRPQHNGSSDEGSPDHRLLMMRRKFFMKEQDRKERLALKLKKKAEKSPLSSPKMRKSLAKLANSLKETMRRKLEAAKKAQRTEEGSQTPVPSASVLRQMLPDPAAATVTRPTSSDTAVQHEDRALSPDNQNIIADNGFIQERLPSLYIGALYPSSDSNSDSDSDEDAPIQAPARTPSPEPHVNPAVSPVLADIVDNEAGSIHDVPARELTPQPVRRCWWPRCTNCRGLQEDEDIPPVEIVPEQQPAEEINGEADGREDGDGIVSPNHIEPMGDGDFNDDPFLDQPMASPGSNQPPVHPDDDEMDVDPPSRPPTPRPLTPVSPGSNPDGHMCGSHCRCPRLYGPQKNRRPARPAPYRPPRRNQEGRAPRQRQTDPQFGRLRHVRNLTGANLPDAPPVVVNQRRVITGSHLEEAMQMQVVNGDNYQAALYHPGVVVFRGHFNGGSRAAALIRQAEEQPVTLFHQPNDPAISIAGGPNHLMILTRSGHVHTIGRPTEGQLGVGDPTRHRQSSVTPQGMLRRVFENNGRDEVIFRSIRTEGNVSVAITLTGREFKCGEEYGDVFRETDESMDTDDESDDE